MYFGFSYVGLIYLIMLMFERVGEVLVSGTALVFSDFNIKPWSNRSWWVINSCEVERLDIFRSLK